MLRLKPSAAQTASIPVVRQGRELTPKQLRFCQEYVIDLNATQAAIRAGYSAKAAEAEGSRLLRNVKVRSEIDRLNTEKANELGITHKYVLSELKKRVSDMGNYIAIDPDGLPRIDLSGIKPEHTAALKEATVETYWDEGAPVPMPEDWDEEENGPWKPVFGRPVKKVKISLTDSLSALEKLGRHLNLFGDRDQDRAAMGDASIGRAIVEMLMQRRLPEKPANAIEI